MQYNTDLNFHARCRAQAVGPFLRTKNPKKALASFRKASNTIDDVHRQIWPGVIIEKMRTKHHLQSVNDNLQQMWFNEKTMSSSAFVAFAVFAVSNKYRTILDRATACTAFVSLIHLVCSSTGGFELDHWPAGHDSDIPVKLHVDGNGFVDGRVFWDSDFFISSVRRTWRNDYQNNKKDWLMSHDGRASKMSLAELICFCLDPQHGVEMQDAVVSPVLDLMSEICVILDRSRRLSNLDRLADSIDFKNKRKMRSAVKRVWVQEIAEKVWCGEDSCQKLGNCYFCIPCPREAKS